MPEKFAVYFSHSWDSEHVDLNLFVWEQIHERCKLLVDLPDENAPHPPYYINRIEELLCRSDLFIAVLPYREPKADASPEQTQTHCSAGALFEIRLAERANLPRLVLYDVRTHFKPPQNPPKHAVYIRRQFEEVIAALPSGEGALRDQIQDWLARGGKQSQPKSNDRPIEAYILLPRALPDRQQVFTRIRDAVTSAGFDEPIDLDGAFQSDAELFQILSRGGLLVADVSNGEQFPAYCIAHALFVPAVRLWPSQAEFSVADLPSLLRGHPGGYQHDLVRWRAPEDLSAAIKAHAAAMFAVARPVAGYDEGCRLFEKRRYAKHSVFLSHNFPQNNREVIDAIMRGFKAVSIQCWEYLDANRAGEKWRERMEGELKKATHFAILLSPDYEQKEACVAEIEWALEHAVPIIPFLVGGRTNPHVKVRADHHQPLRGTPPEDAAAVVERVRDILLARKTLAAG